MTTLMVADVLEKPEVADCVLLAYDAVPGQVVPVTGFAADQICDRAMGVAPTFDGKVGLTAAQGAERLRRFGDLPLMAIDPWTGEPPYVLITGVDVCEFGATLVTARE